MEKVIRFENLAYGTHKCSRCGVNLKGIYNVVSLESDDEGEHWRGFCSYCWEDDQLKNETNEDLYNTYDPCEEQ